MHELVIQCLFIDTLSSKNSHIADEMLEKNKTEVDLHDMDAQALAHLVEYAYTSQVTISENNVQVASG